MDSDERLLVVNRVGKTTIIANVVLSVFKIASGIIARSGAMVADGIHTLSDVCLLYTSNTYKENTFAVYFYNSLNFACTKILAYKGKSCLVK